MSKIQLPRNEEGEQEAVVQYLQLMQSSGKIRKFTSIPNSTWTPSQKQKNKNKRLGLNPGFPDLIILTYEHAFCIEMKVKPNKPTEEQKDWGVALQYAQVRTFLCYSYEEAKDVIDREIKYTV
jgi:hypothetical protein